MSYFTEVIEKQAANKTHLFTQINPPCGGFTLVINNNKITQTIDGTGWVHPSRKFQYVALFNNVLDKYSIKNCNININLVDHPKEGYFNFCRKINNNKCFLLPTNRFTCCDIKIANKSESFKNYDEQRAYIFSLHKSDLINKIYTSCIPHKPKIEYFRYAATHNDFCDGYCYIGGCHGKLALDDELIAQLKPLNMCGNEPKPWADHLNYKYLLYNDGNSLSDRMMLLLCSNSVIFKQTSPYEEFFSYKLKNNVNYAEYSNVNELKMLFDRFEKDADAFNLIVKNNKEFTTKLLSYNQILLYCSTLINQLF